MTKIDEVGVEDTRAYHNPREIFNTQRSPYSSTINFNISIPK
jgi:hypothetical protein